MIVPASVESTAMMVPATPYMSLKSQILNHHSPRPSKQNKTPSKYSSKFSSMEDAKPISSAMRLSEVQELPMGYKFRPNPCDLIQYFLIPKSRGEELPVEELSKMHLRDLDVYTYEPDELPLNQLKYALENEGYFFVRDHNTASQIRATPNGYWKIYKENVPVYGRDGVVGFKNKLEYYSGKTPHEHKTNWRMIEFMAHQSPLLAYTYDKDSYIVCKVKQKRIKDEGVLLEEEWEEEEEIESSEKEIGYSDGSNGDSAKALRIRGARPNLFITNANGGRPDLSTSNGNGERPDLYISNANNDAFCQTVEQNPTTSFRLFGHIIKADEGGSRSNTDG